MYERLRALRKELGIPIQELMDLLDLKTEAAYYKKESGIIKFSLEEAKLIAKRMDKPIEEIFFASEVSVMDTGISA